MPTEPFILLIVLLVSVTICIFEGPRRKKNSPPVVEKNWHEWMLENDLIYKEIDEERIKNEYIDKKAIARAVYDSLPRVGTYDDVWHNYEKLYDLSPRTKQRRTYLMYEHPEGSL